LQNLRLRSFIFGNFLIILLAAGVRILVCLAGRVLSKKLSLDSESLRSFECGFVSYTQRLLPFRLRFYLLANIFLIFDVELILLFPFIISVTFIQV